MQTCSSTPPEPSIRLHGRSHVPEQSRRDMITYCSNVSLLQAARRYYVLRRLLYTLSPLFSNRYTISYAKRSCATALLDFISFFRRFRFFGSFQIFFRPSRDRIVRGSIGMLLDWNGNDRLVWCSFRGGV